jgi:hypothetical protein
MDEFRAQFHRGGQIGMKTRVAASADAIARVKDDDGTRTAAYDVRCTGETRRTGPDDHNVSSVLLRHWVLILTRLNDCPQPVVASPALPALLRFYLVEISAEIERVPDGVQKRTWPHEERMLNLWGPGFIRS